MRRQAPAGFTLVELLVVIAIIGVLVAMSIPAIQASRELGRRTMCQANLGQIALAVQSYENAFEVLPSGVINPDGPIRNEPVGLHQGWLIAMLPYLDESSAYQHMNFSKSVYDPANAPLRELSLTVLICPSDPSDERAKSNYAGCHHDVEAPIAGDNLGVLFLNSHVRRLDIPDGAAHTIFVAEKRLEPGDLGWMSGTRATLRNTGLPPNDPITLGLAESPAAPPSDPAAGADAPGSPLYVGGFASAHTGGLFVGFGDASVRFIAEEIDLDLWHQLGHRADGKLLNTHFDPE
jgi:prepilin-type N-terminal cleavage/methylation domain-containing protein